MQSMLVNSISVHKALGTTSIKVVQIQGWPKAHTHWCQWRVLDSAYVFIGGLHVDMTEGDVITVFSQ
jgi:hypothetical protein